MNVGVNIGHGETEGRPIPQRLQSQHRTSASIIQDCQTNLPLFGVPGSLNSRETFSLYQGMFDDLKQGLNCGSELLFLEIRMVVD